MQRIQLTSLVNTRRFACLTLLSILSYASPALGSPQWSVHQVPDATPVPQYVPQTMPRSKPTGTFGETGTVLTTGPKTMQDSTAAPLPNFFDRSEGRGGSASDADTLVANPLRTRPSQSTIPQSQTTSPRTATPPPLQTPVAIEPATLPPTPTNPRSISDRTSESQVVPTPNLVLPMPIEAAPAIKMEQHGDQMNEKKFSIDYSIYRDTNPYPIDPRKPCSQCTLGPSDCRCKILGNQGRPYQEKELGGCQCNSRHPWKHPEFSVHWPRPFSAKLDERHPEAAAARYSACQPKRIVDVFDSLSTLKISNYKRTDNGYCGPNSDPYGCLSESKISR